MNGFFKGIFIMVSMRIIMVCLIFPFSLMGQYTEKDCTEIFYTFSDSSFLNPSMDLIYEIQDSLQTMNFEGNDLCYLQIKNIEIYLYRYLFKIEEGLQSVEQILSNPIVENYPDQKITALLEKADLIFQLGDISHVTSLLDTILHLKDSLNLELDLPTLNVLSSTLFDHGYVAESNSILKALDKKTSPTDSTQIYFNNYRLALNFYAVYDYKSCEKYLKKAMKYLHKMPPYVQEEFYIVYGLTCRELKEFEKGIAFCEKAIDLEIGDTTKLVFAYLGLLYCNMDQNIYEFSEDYPNKIKILLENKELPSNCRREALETLMEFYFYRKDKIRHQFFFNEYHSYLDTSEMVQLYELYKNDIYTVALEKFNAQEFELFNKYQEIRTQVFDLNVNTINKNFEAKFQNEKKEGQNKYLLKEKNLKEAIIAKQRNYMVVGGVVLSLLVLLSFLLWKITKEKEKANLELDARNRQIELLSKELSHRFKNQLNIATSLLNIQKKSLQDETIKSVLQDSENRMNVLLLVSQQLSSDQENLEIELKTYMEGLIKNLEFSMAPLLSKKLEINQECSLIQCDSKLVLKLGLIVNELITNSIKHAFEYQPTPRILIEIKENNNELILKFKDNGVGTKNGYNNYDRTQGLSLIEDIILDLEGEYESFNKDGYCFTIIIPQYKCTLN